MHSSFSAHAWTYNYMSAINDVPINSKRIYIIIAKSLQFSFMLTL